jgi:tol-pal system protein YbgF
MLKADRWTSGWTGPVRSVVAVGAIVFGGATLAQAPSQQAPTPKAAPRAAPAAKAEPGDGAARPATDGALRQRVEQLEEQLVDMQVMVGTLESLARGGGGGGSAARAPSGGGGADGVRLDAIETQIRALSAQVEQLSRQMRQRQGAAPGGDQQFAGRDADPEPPRGRPSPATSGGWSTTQQQASLPPPRAGTGGAASDAMFADGDSKQLYETAYGYLLQQDYGAAEAAFDDFLRRFPNDALSGNAQYWLGESFYVRGNYKSAASAFLKGYQTYGRSQKAPDSLLKLGLSLDRLGQKDAACSSFGELATRFPSAPAQVKSRAESERRRLGCA